MPSKHSEDGLSFTVKRTETQETGVCSRLYRTWDGSNCSARGDRWRSAEREQVRACCYKQVGVPKNLVIAVDWNEKAGERGRTDKGTLWWTDRGVKEDGEG